MCLVNILYVCLNTHTALTHASTPNIIRVDQNCHTHTHTHAHALTAKKRENFTQKNYYRVAAICLNSINANWIRHAVICAVAVAVLRSHRFISFRYNHHHHHHNQKLYACANFVRGWVNWYASSSGMAIHTYIEKYHSQLVEWQMVFQSIVSICRLTFIFRRVLDFRAGLFACQFPISRFIVDSRVCTDGSMVRQRMFTGENECQ